MTTENTFCSNFYSWNLRILCFSLSCVEMFHLNELAPLHLFLNQIKQYIWHGPEVYREMYTFHRRNKPSNYEENIVIDYY